MVAGLNAPGGLWHWAPAQWRALAEMGSPCLFAGHRGIRWTLDTYHPGGDLAGVAIGDQREVGAVFAEPITSTQTIDRFVEAAGLERFDNYSFSPRTRRAKARW